MGNKKNIKKHKNHKKIRGSLVCFRKTELERLAYVLAKGPLIEDWLIYFRNLGKEGMGVRMKMATQTSRVYAPISEKSLAIIRAHMLHVPGGENAYRFLECFFEAYNGEEHRIMLNSPKYTSTNKNKALKCAAKDCKKAFLVYFRPILVRMTDENLTQLLDNELVGKYKDIEKALDFALEYLYALHCWKMPTRLSKELFYRANQIDNSLSMHYQFDSTTHIYILDNTKNNKYSTISQECATYLICHTHK